MDKQLQINNKSTSEILAQQGIVVTDEMAKALGNVSSLNVIQIQATDSRTTEIMSKVLGICRAQIQDVFTDARDNNESLHNFTSRMEKGYIELILEESEWNELQAARFLELGRTTLRAKMKGLRIKKPSGDNIADDSF